MASAPAERESRRCLVIAAHPDDVESWASGTVAGLAQAGWRVTYILCTSGDRGTSDPNEAPAVVSARREAEQRAACRVAGASEPVFLGLPDGELEDNRALRASLVREIRRFRPDLLLTHDPVTPWPPYTCHRDHRITGRVALDAAYPYARDPLSFPEHLRQEGLRPHITPEVWLFCTSAPDYYVDIAATLDVKIAARLEHRSQTADPDALTASWRQRAAESGAPAGLPAAESFKRLWL
jgi:LmbE family N-acetylglucosaminyl deacetylase